MKAKVITVALFVVVFAVGWVATDLIRARLRHQPPFQFAVDKDQHTQAVVTCPADHPTEYCPRDIGDRLVWGITCDGSDGNGWTLSWVERTVCRGGNKWFSGWSRVSAGQPDPQCLNLEHALALISKSEPIIPCEGAR